MHRVIKKLLRRYGTAMVLVHDGQEQEVRAFLQETRSRSQSQVEKGISPLGEIPRGDVFVYRPGITEGRSGGCDRASAARFRGAPWGNCHGCGRRGLLLGIVRGEGR